MLIHLSCLNFSSVVKLSKDILCFIAIQQHFIVIQQQHLCMYISEAFTWVEKFEQCSFLEDFITEVQNVNTLPPLQIRQ